MSVAIDLVACVICRGGNDTNGCPLIVFSLDIVFAHHFMATHPTPSSYSIGVLVVLAMPVKELSTCKMAGSSASYPLNNWLIDRL